MQTRYPGTQSFSSSQRDIFFGRDADIDKLTEMLELERMILVYAKSGIGKTSLINAGVLPNLKEKGNYTFQSIRYGSWTRNSDTLDKLKQKTLSKLHEPQNYLDKIISNDQSLWYYAKMWQLKQIRENKSKDQTLLFILDQFEELFTFPEEQVINFKKELAELLFTAVPQRFIDQKELLQDIKPDFLTKEEEKLLFEQPKVKIMFAIRSDRMSQLNKISDYIPRILLKHYELAPLTEQQAIDAIRKPAKLNGNFSSPKFTYSEKALQSIMFFLTKQGEQTNNIESFQLQILCQVVETKIRNKEIINKDEPIVEDKHIKPVKDIYQNFYDNLILALPYSNDKKFKARIMIEDGLIEEATKRRLQLSGEQIKHQYNIDNDTLFQLVNERLLRTEERDRFRVYELAHDTLVEPILESRKIRKEAQRKQEEIEIEKEKLRIEREKAEKERKERERERKKQQTIILIVSIAAIISIAFGIFGFVNMKNANNTLLKLKRTQFDKYFEDANRLKKEAKYTEAIEKYKDAQILLPDIHTPKDSITICLQKLELKDEFDNNIKIIDSLIRKDDYENAMELTENTLLLDYNNKIVNEKITTIKNKGSTFYYEKAKQMHYLGQRTTAKDYINKALKFAPNNKNILEFKDANYPDN